MQRYCRDGERDDGISMMVFFGIPSKFHHRGVAASVPRRTCGDDGLLKNPRFPPFSGRLWMRWKEQITIKGNRRTAHFKLSVRNDRQISTRPMCCRISCGTRRR